mmetsp:Transcript_97474/g.303610  ORF Transcript_97474/g.303610 Transcript_97474/m.303610 type:complete len:231 (-) Transcript_97474:545-1237(-)
MLLDAALALVGLVDVGASTGARVSARSPALRRWAGAGGRPGAGARGRAGLATLGDNEAVDDVAAAGDELRLERGEALVEGVQREARRLLLPDHVDASGEGGGVGAPVGAATRVVVLVRRVDHAPSAAGDVGLLTVHGVVLEVVHVAVEVEVETVILDDRHEVLLVDLVGRVVAHDDEPIVLVHRVDLLLQPLELRRAVLLHNVLVEAARPLHNWVAVRELRAARVPTRGA